MVIVAARPSMGKTALAMNLAQNIGFNKKQLRYFL
jgi:replicative DNA helicase